MQQCSGFLALLEHVLRAARMRTLHHMSTVAQVITNSRLWLQCTALAISKSAGIILEIRLLVIEPCTRQHVCESACTMDHRTQRLECCWLCICKGKTVTRQYPSQSSCVRSCVPVAIMHGAQLHRNTPLPSPLVNRNPPKPNLQSRLNLMVGNAQCASLHTMPSGC